MLIKLRDYIMTVLVNYIAQISIVALLAVLLALTVSLHTLHENNELQAVKIAQLSDNVTQLTNTVHAQQIMQHQYALHMTSQLSGLSVHLSEIQTQVHAQNVILKHEIIQNHHLLKEIKHLRYELRMSYAP